MKLGEIYWDQLSIWEFSPDDCIEGYRKVKDSIYHYVLKEVVEITANNSWKVVCTTDKTKVPCHPLMDEVYLNINNNRTRII